MFNYLKIFSWFLFTFGVVGLGAMVFFGVDPGIGTRTQTIGLMTLQIGISSVLLAGFKLYSAGKIGRSTLLYGGWGLILLLIVIGQVWINIDSP